MKAGNVRLIFALLLIIITSSCAREVYDISWRGVVVDKQTGEPVQQAQVSATSVYQKNIDETAEVEDRAVTNEEGRFHLSFPRGFGLTVKTNASGYLNGVDYKVINQPELADTIFISPHPFNASLVVRMRDPNSFSASAPFLREARVFKGAQKTQGKRIQWGFDFLNGSNTTHLDSADIWIEVNHNTGQFVLHSSAEGGIFPVFSSDDFLTHMTRAPNSGYVESHVRTGEESGYFVLCRNGVHVAKVIPEERICVLTYENEEGAMVEEIGIRFDYLFQPDLKNRLYFPVSASAEGGKRQSGDQEKVFKTEVPE